MPDREKVIKGLAIERECVSRDCNRDCARCDLAQDREWLLSVYDEVLELLKEQETVIRCKDCKHYDTITGICGKSNTHGYADAWYCADGRRKTVRWND